METAEFFLELAAILASARLLGELLRPFGIPTVVDGKIRSDAPPAQLYDLEHDLRQTKNLFGQKPKTVNELDAILQRYRAKIPSSEPLGWINLKQ